MEAAARADGKPTITIDTGTARRAEGHEGTWVFPDLKITSSDPAALIRSITIQFTSAITVGSDAVLAESDVANGFEVLSASKDGTAVINNAEGATVAQWEAYLKAHSGLRLAEGGDGDSAKSLRMTASFKTQDKIYDYNAENGHYYELVAKDVNWSTARSEASQSVHSNGMRGYLLTITSQEESDFVTSMISSNTWVGATCRVDGGYGAPAEDTVSSSGFTVNKDWGYYWVTGPEAFGDTTDPAHPEGKPLKFSTGTTTSLSAVDDVRPTAKPGEKIFMNWDNALCDSPGQTEPNNSGGEYVMFMWGTISNRKVGAWNDVVDAPSPGGHATSYIVEYGGMPDDPEEGDDGVGADVAVKVEITVDPTGKTIHTQASDIQVGDPVEVRDTANGGPVTTTKDGSTAAADVEHTYFVRDPDDPAADADGWRPLRPDEAGADGAPAHAGEYKVISSAVHSYDADGKAVPYTPGSDTFVITPRAIDSLEPDPTAPAPDPANPSEGDLDGNGVPKRSWAKVYDGTTDLGVTSASLADLVGVGADVRLVWDTASFDGEDVSESRTVTFSGLRLAGADAADYDISAIAPGGVMTALGRIVPRDLVVTASSSVKRGWEGEPLRDATGAPVSFTHDLDVWPGTGAWAPNMLAPRDGERASDGTVDSILGEAALTCLRRGDGLPLDGESPAAGDYEVAVTFANVPGSARVLGAAGLPDDGGVSGDRGVAARAAGGVPAAQAGEAGARSGVDNYRITLVSSEVEVGERTADPSPQPPTAPDGDHSGGKRPDIVIDEIVNLPSDFSDRPLGKDDMLADIVDRFGDRPEYPKGDVTVTIVRDGEAVEAVDPSVPGTYVVTATYTDADGTVRVVRVTYVVGEPGASVGPATALRRLAQTGDGLALALPLGAAAAAGALALALRRRRTA